MPWFRAVALWLAIMAAESIHGTLRQLFLAPAIGDLPARRVAVLSGVVIMFAITLWAVRWLSMRTTAALLAVGMLWVILTIVFEFALGRIVMRYEWSRLLEDYDLARGGLMGLGLLAMLFMPLGAARLRGMPVGSG